MAYALVEIIGNPVHTIVMIMIAAPLACWCLYVFKTSKMMNGKSEFHFLLKCACGYHNHLLFPSFVSNTIIISTKHTS